MPDIGIVVQLNEINQKMINQQNVFNDTIQSIRNDFDEKTIQFSSTIKSLKNDIESIKTFQCKCESGALQPLWHNNKSNLIINYLIHGMCINQVENEYEYQINQLRDRIEAIEMISKKSSNINEVNIEEKCECEYKLFDDANICT